MESSSGALTERTTAMKQNQRVPIIYEDNHLLVVEKPVNMLSQSDSTGDLDLLTLLKEDLKQRYQKPGNVYLGLVHRLDRPVGGIMVFAKTSKAASRLSQQVVDRKIEKTYLAIVHGSPRQKQGELIHYLEKDRKANRVTAHLKPGGERKKAQLDYEVIASSEGFSLVRVHLHTGRSHQIRVQLATIGHPLYGDQRYGAQRTKQGEQIALWAYELGLTHPTTKEQLFYRCNPPKQFPWVLFKT